MVHAIAALNLAALVDIVPGFTTVTVHYEPLAISRDALRLRIEAALAQSAPIAADDGRLVEIPVCYGGEFGPDLDAVAAAVSLTTQEVVDRHTAREYRVHLLGFLPGFAYLGGLDARIATPRRATPRDRVPAGSVGIAGSQTGVYPLESPGGWQLIGRSPATMFDPTRMPPTLLAAGDRVRFVPIDRHEYDRMRAGTTTP